MSARRTRAQWWCACALLLLAISPLTAPFAAGHPLDLLGGSAAHIQSKKAPDDPLVSASTSLTVLTPVDLIAPAIVRVVAAPLAARPHSHARPLRL
ncbi:MAG: hypothetical protein AB7L71_14010 [Vicinamibacterales bacterium]